MLQIQVIVAAVCRSLQPYIDAMSFRNRVEPFLWIIGVCAGMGLICLCINKLVRILHCDECGHEQEIKRLHNSIERIKGA